MAMKDRVGMYVRLLTALLLLPASFALGSEIIRNPFGFETLYQEGSPRSHFDGVTLTSIFPAGIYGNETSGFSFGARIKPSMTKVIQYEVKFSEDFDFVKGGKLPGLCGGRNASGGTPATGKNGFSARLMWRRNGQLVSYVYHVDQKTEYGDDFQWIGQSQKPVHLKRGVWHKIKMEVSMNGAGKSNGTIRGFFNGSLVFEKNDFLFRTVERIKVDRLCFNTFFGGGDQSWAPSKDEKLFIRNLKIEG